MRIKRLSLIKNMKGPLTCEQAARAAKLLLLYLSLENISFDLKVVGVGVRAF